MQRDADTLLSNNEKAFIIQALREERRIDGRGPYELRKPNFQFALDDSSCTVLLGQTRVMTVITASLEAPYPDRPNEGSVRFMVEFSPMASPAFEAGRPGEEATEVARLIERGLRESRAVDQEALVVVSGRKVWHLRVDIHVLDHQGNLVDACGLSALGALMVFRRPDVTVGGGEDGQAVTVHSPEVREPVPLSIHHLPVPVSFAFFEGGSLMVVDPSLKEEAASSGGLTVTLNLHGELCAVQKAKGVGLPASEIMRCIRVAGQKVEDLTNKLKKALEAHAVARVQARVRRRAAPADIPLGHLPGQAPAPEGAQHAQQAGLTTQQAQLAGDAAAGLPRPVQEILRALEKEEGDADGAMGMASDEEDEQTVHAMEEEEAGTGAANGAGGVGAALPGGSSGGRDAPWRDGTGMQHSTEPPATAATTVPFGDSPSVGQVLDMQQQRQHDGQQPSSQGRKKAKRVRRASQPGAAPEGADEFEAIASLIAGAGGRGQQGGLEAAVKQRQGGQRGKPVGKRQTERSGS
ncbi:hypothetical protein N2152v2_009443 [Parachlorella kessleri]